MRRCAVCLVLAAVPSAAWSAALEVEVRGRNGTLLDSAVVFAIPEKPRPGPPPRDTVMDQMDRMFVPHVLPVQKGTRVRFPNHDNVRHQVYSFSAAKRFQLPLYQGSPGAPVVFDKPGVVDLGCNIHDRMSAFIVVVDTPHFAVTQKGRAELNDLPAGQYAVRVWYEGMRAEPAPQQVELGAAETRPVAFAPAR